MRHSSFVLAAALAFVSALALPATAEVITADLQAILRRALRMGAGAGAAIRPLPVRARDDVGALKVGMPVELVLETLYADADGERLIWKWKPAAAQAETRPSLPTSTSPSRSSTTTRSP